MSQTTSNTKLWAAEVLGVAPEVSPEEARRAFLQRLAQSDFLPPPAWQQAARVLAREARAANEVLPVEGPWLDAEEERLREAVDDFAVSYFDLAPGERRLRWEKLRDESSWSPPLSARLRELEAGLAIATPQAADGHPLLPRLIDQVCSLYTRRRAERAVKRQELLHELAFEPKTDQQMIAWQGAAQELRKKYPALAELEPVLVHRLVNWKKLRRAVHEARQPGPRPFKPRAAPVQGGVGNWPIWVAIVLMIAGFRFCAGATSRPPQPSYDRERYRIPVLPTSPYKTNEEMERLLKEYQRGRSPSGPSGSSDTEPWWQTRPSRGNPPEAKGPPLTPEQEALRQYRMSRGARGEVDPAKPPGVPGEPVAK